MGSPRWTGSLRVAAWCSRREAQETTSSSHLLVTKTTLGKDAGHTLGGREGSRLSTWRSLSMSTLLALLMTSSASCTTLLQPSARMGGQPSLLGEETGEESGEEPEEEVYGSGDGDDYATVIYEDY